MIRLRDTFKFCTKCKTELEVRESGSKICPDCQKEYFFNAVPSASLIVTNETGEMLLTKRAREPFIDWWDLPGGFVEEGETFEQAGERELKEETGLTVYGMSYVGSYADDYHYGGEVISATSAVFTGRVKSDEKVQVADDVADFMFIPLKDVNPEEIAFDNQRKFVAEFLKRS